ncbi:MAG: 50S ribosomal protein L25 [Limnochordia bacterium]|jgi:large subunit ribosomal protein L25
MASLAIQAVTRQATGKGAARRARAAGKAPAVMYGVGIDSRLLELDARELERLVEQGAHGRLITLSLDGETRAVILKDVQRHPVKGTVLHVDFHAVALDEVLQTSVVVIITGDAEREDDGGVLVHGTRELIVECLPTDIPEHFEADVSGLEIGGTVRAEDVVMPPGVSLVSDPDTVIASVVIPRSVIEEDEEDEEEQAEPELIGESDDDEEKTDSDDE